MLEIARLNLVAGVVFGRLRLGEMYVKQFVSHSTTQLRVFSFVPETFIENEIGLARPDDAADAHRIFAYDQEQLVAYARITTGINGDRFVRCIALVDRTPDEATHESNHQQC